MNKTVLLATCALLSSPLALAHFPAGPKDFCESHYDWSEHDYVAPGGPVVVPGDGNVSGDCNGAGVPADPDGHRDYGIGGVWLKADHADPSCPDDYEDPHHPVGGPFRAHDAVSSGDVSFHVTADTNCDDVADVSAACLASCAVPFFPGLDGYYVVLVTSGDGGHVYSP